MVIQSVATAILGVRLRWHTINRQGTFSAPDTLGGELPEPVGR
ncbi:hypothetical protein [Microbispora bryophytorum]